MSKKNGKEIKIHLSFAMILTTAILFALSFGALIYFVKSYYYPSYVAPEKQNVNFEISARNASAVESEIKDIRSDVLLFLDSLNAVKSSRVAYNQLQSYFFQHHNNVVSVVLSNNKKFYNNNYLFTNNIETSSIEAYLEQIKPEIQEAEAGGEIVLNAAPFFKLPILTFLYSWNENGLDQTAIALVSCEKLTDVFYSNDENVSYLVNHRGDLLIHPDYSLIEAGANMSSKTEVKTMRNTAETLKADSYKNAEGKEIIYSFAKITISDLAVITQGEQSTIPAEFEESLKMMVYLAGALFFAVLIVILIVTLIMKFVIQKRLRREAAQIVESENS